MSKAVTVLLLSRFLYVIQSSVDVMTSRESFFGGKQARRSPATKSYPRATILGSLLLSQTLRTGINMCKWKRQRLAFSLAGRVLV